jgi:hypothetical protein
MPTCTQAKCPIATTGVCLEGHTQGCPHIISDPATQLEPVAEAASASSMLPTPPEPYRFHSGEKLTALEASWMIRALPVKMVLCAGAQWAGKTTFLARIGEMFRNGSFNDFRFAGSKTLCGFERASWLATIASGAGQPDTKRTSKVEKDTFFHLQVRRVGNEDDHIDVLISDLPGEIFPDVVSTKDVCEEQLALARADQLVLFLDCKSLIDDAKRHSERDMACRFLSQVKRCRHAPITLQVNVVFSRWDYVCASQSRHEHEAYCEIVEQDIRTRFEATFGGLRFDRIAARPAGTAPTNAEIQTLFGLWLESPHSLPIATVSRKPKPARDFSAFGLR